MIIFNLIAPVIAALIGSGHGQVVSFGLRKLAASTNQFGLDLMRALDRSESRSAFCPICISSSLAMTLAGAQGHSATSLRHALYLWGMQPNEVHLAYFDMMNHLGVNLPSHTNAVYRRMGLFSPPSTSGNYLTSGSNQVSLGSPFNKQNSSEQNDVTLLNNVYVQRDFPINYHYHLLLQRFYKTAVHPLDFHYNFEETRSHINAYVEKQTAGKIKEILPKKANELTQLLLLSALCFRGALDIELHAVRPPAPPQAPAGPVNPFGPQRPVSLVFGEESPIWYESKNARLRHGFSRYLDATTIEMPFKGGLITLVLMMPTDPNGLETLLTRLSAQVLMDTVSNLDVRRVHVKMPRISIDSGMSNLTWALSNLGLADLFKPGYSQLYDVSDYKWLSVSDVIHKTVLDIKEPPATAGHFTQNFDQATAESNPSANPIKHLMYNQAPSSTMGQTAIPGPNDEISVVFDKPFVYFVFDNVAGLVLVMGRSGREPATYRLPI